MSSRHEMTLFRGNDFTPDETTLIACDIFADVSDDACQARYSTVTLLARLRGWSTSVPLRMATW